MLHRGHHRVQRFLHFAFRGKVIDRNNLKLFEAFRHSADKTILRKSDESLAQRSSSRATEREIKLSRSPDFRPIAFIVTHAVAC